MKCKPWIGFSKYQTNLVVVVDVVVVSVLVTVRVSTSRIVTVLVVSVVLREERRKEIR